MAVLDVNLKTNYLLERKVGGGGEVP